MMAAFLLRSSVTFNDRGVASYQEFQGMSIKESNEYIRRSWQS
jgi:hypothetical protein